MSKPIAYAEQHRPSPSLCETLKSRAIPKVEIRAFVPVRIFGNIDSTFLSFTRFADSKDHFAIRLAGTDQSEIPLVRLHSECVTGDVFGSSRCDCGPQLNEAVHTIAKAGGYILYLRQEGRGIGLPAKLQAYELQDRGMDTYEANEALGVGRDLRTYDAAAQMLFALGSTGIRLLSNNPDKVESLRRLGITVHSVVPTSLFLTAENARYMQAKQTKGGHFVTLS